MLALSAIALAVQVMVPSGFMLAAPAGQSLQVVVCTGHGPLRAVLDLGKSKTPPPRDRSGAPCGFAGHGGATTPPPAPTSMRIAWSPATIATSTLADQVMVGRGLAAPPPARGPPTPLA